MIVLIIEEDESSYHLDIDDYYKFDRYQNLPIHSYTSYPKPLISGVTNYHTISFENFYEILNVGTEEIPKAYIFKKLHDKKIEKFYCASFTMTM